MSKIDERERLIYELAKNLCVSEIDIKDSLKDITTAFNDDAQTCIELSKQFTEKYKNKFFRDISKEFGCGRCYMRIENIYYNPDEYAFYIKGELCIFTTLKIGGVNVTYDKCCVKKTTLDFLNSLKTVDESEVYQYISCEFDFLKRSCKNFLPQE